MNADDALVPPRYSVAVSAGMCKAPVTVMVDPATGLAYLHEQGGAPILITRSDDYWDH